MVVSLFSTQQWKGWLQGGGFLIVSHHSKVHIGSEGVVVKGTIEHDDL